MPSIWLRHYAHAVIALLLAAYLYAPDVKGADLPVHWTADVSIQTLDDIESALDQPLYEMTLTGNSRSGEGVAPSRVVKTGREWLAALQDGYYAVTSIEMGEEAGFKFHYEPMLLLRDHARPSKVSYVDKYEFTDASIRQLPVTIHPVYDMAMREAISAGRKFPNLPDNWEDRSKPLPVDSPAWPRFSEVFDGARTEIQQPNATHVIEGTEEYGKDIFLRIIAWGDFNGDGVEDMLLTSSTSFKGGTGRYDQLLLLTRLEPAGPLLELSQPK